VGHTLEVIVRPQGKKPAWENYLGGDCIVQLGFDQDQALLPYDNRSFQGYRLLQEYFAFPKRFLFVEIQGLLESCKQCAGNKIELLLLFDETKNGLEEVVNQSNFSLFATPVVNLFPKTVDRIHLSDQYSEHHVVPDRTRPMDFEIYQITGVQGIGTSQEQKQEFLPFYASRDGVSAHSDKAFYSLNRLPRMLSAKQKRMGPRTEYVGNEVYISLVDAADAPYSHDLKQLAITALCTNRDLPYHISIGQGTTDFYLDSGEDVKSVRVLSGPTKPRPSPAYNDGETAWRLINHLSLNYLSISDAGDEEGAVALRELLKLYSDADDVPSQNQIEGVRSIHSSSITRRLPTPGPIVFGRGIDIAVELDELSFEGMGVFLLGAVLERFFSGYASINTFTETRIKTTKRGEIIRWPARIGSRQRL
jgi:type VI secretion system protein ImpG